MCSSSRDPLVKKGTHGHPKAQAHLGHLGHPISPSSHPAHAPNAPQRWTGDRSQVEDAPTEEAPRCLHRAGIDLGSTFQERSPKEIDIKGRTKKWDTPLDLRYFLVGWFECVLVFFLLIIYCYYISFLNCSFGHKATVLAVG